MHSTDFSPTQATCPPSPPYPCSHEQRRLDANASELERVCATQKAKKAKIVANMEAQNTEKAAQAQAQAITLVATAKAEAARMMAEAKAKGLELELKAIQGFCQNFVVAFKTKVPEISTDRTMGLAVQYLKQRSLGKAIADSGIQSIGSNVFDNLGFNVKPYSPNGKAQPSSTDEKSPTMGHSIANA